MNIQLLCKDHLVQYEQSGHLEINSLYNYLIHIRKFVNYLNMMGVIDFKYVIPDRFYTKIKRRNSYVTTADRERLLDVIFSSNKKTQLRDLCIVLLLIVTGCRSSEICSLRIEDVHKTEHTINIYSKKSSSRTLDIPPYIMEYLAHYIEKERKFDFPHHSLFLSTTGTVMSSNNIGNVVHTYNKLAFNEKKFSSVDLRHTFITDALDNKNDLDQVADAAGHKHWRSTMHYLHRSHQRLLDNTLPFSPL